MQPYWITIERGPEPTPLNLGAGITAISEADARVLFAETFEPVCRIERIVAVTDIRDIEQGHVVPNMGNWFRRGVWFPLGYAQKG